TRKRRSTATGCCRASRWTACSSTTISMRSISASAAMTSAAFFSSTSVSASIARWIWRSTSPPMRIRLRRRSSSCSEKCSLTNASPFSLGPSSAEEGLGGNHLEVPLQDRLVASRRHRTQDRLPVEDPLEEVCLAAGALELRLAVAARDRVELDTAGPDSAHDVGHELPMAAVETVGDPQNRGELLDDRPQVGVEALPV